MMTVTANEARTRWADLIDLTRSEPVEITRRGKVVAVLVKPEFFERALDALEELEDLLAVEEAESEIGDPVSLEEVKRELGL